LLIASLAVQMSISRSHIATLEAQQQTLQTELAASQGSVKQLQTAVSEQNAAVDALKQAADARVATHAKELAAAKIAANSANLQAKNLMDRVRPQDKTACDAAEQLLNEEIGK
jgi:uncharacterized protein YlxW (UPF0749 family)